MYTLKNDILLQETLYIVYILGSGHFCEKWSRMRGVIEVGVNAMGKLHKLVVGLYILQLLIAIYK